MSEISEPNDPVSISDLLGSIDVVEIEGQRAFSSESQYVGLALDLLIEAASFACLAANARPAKGYFDRDQAIVIGHAVRLYKLLHGLLDQTSQGRGETAFVFLRLCFETIVNLRYLLRFGTPSVFDDYVSYSLRHERKLWDDIQAKIASRGGAILPIEDRMMRSIKKAAEAGGVNIEEAKASAPKQWGEANLFEKAKKVDLDDAYLAAFGGGSHSVHGNWQDLLDNHLRQVEVGFLGDPEWTRPRPQYLLAVAALTGEALAEVFRQSVEPDEFELVEARLVDLRNRIGAVDSSHEAFLVKRSSRSE